MLLITESMLVKNCKFPQQPTIYPPVKTKFLINHTNQPGT